MRRRSWVLSGITALLAVLAIAAPASGAASLIRSADGKTLTLTFPDNGAGDSLNVQTDDDIVLRENGPDDLNNPVASVANGCSFVSADAVRCPRVSLTSLVVSYGDGDDFSEFQIWTVPEVKVVQRGGPGSDELWGASFADVIEGDAGNDFFEDFGGADTLAGGSGSDTFLLFEGDDDVVGGSEFDLVDYLPADTGVDVTLDDVADDGPAGDTTTSTPISRTSAGRPAADHMRAARLGNFIDGSRRERHYSTAARASTRYRRRRRQRQGRQPATGGGGVDCGPGHGHREGDDIDARTAARPASLSPDRPDDSISTAPRPADCNDGNAASGPALAEIPGRRDRPGLQRRRRADPDRDGDGVPRPTDCDDGDAARPTPATGRSARQQDRRELQRPRRSRSCSSPTASRTRGAPRGPSLPTSPSAFGTVAQAACRCSSAAAAAAPPFRGARARSNGLPGCST